MNILIVDDELVSREKLKKIMSSLGNVLTAESGPEALEIVNSDCIIDLIILDIMMPVMDGYELCKILKSKQVTEQIPIIFISAKNDKEDEAKGLDLGASDYITKPFNPSITKARASTQLKLKKHSDRLEELVKERTIELTQANEQLLQEMDERKRAENALRSENNFSQSLINTAPVIVLVLDRKGCIVSYNRYTEEITGYKLEEVKHKNWFETFLQNNKNKNLAKQFYSQSKWKNSSQKHTTLITKNKKQLQIEWHNKTLKDDNGEAIGLLAIGQDVTEKIQIEKKYFSAQKMESIGTLAGGIAHDFNNILSAINGYVELVLMKIGGQNKIVPDLMEIKRAGTRAKELVAQILTFSRQTRQELKPILIHTIVNEALKLIRSTIPSNIEIIKNIRPCSPIMADGVQIHQVIMNLCTNAYHAMEINGGVLEITLKEIKQYRINDYFLGDSPPGPFVQLTIKDSGHGMDQSIMDRIFDPYFTTKEKGKGTGMGLSVVHGIIENCGGKIQVSSKKQKGTVFEILLPCVKVEVKDMEYRQSPLPRGKETILFVDDEKSLTKLSKSLLERLGYTVFTENSGIKALERFKEDPKKYDLVFSDMAMPKMTGLQMAEKMFAIREDLPFIISTGYSDQIDEKIVLALGISALELKPLDLDKMARIIRDILDRK